MKLVIFAGGTGSIPLQNGLYQTFGKVSGLEYSVVISALDNGLSTGVSRQVFDGKILGPSDLRKNQMTRHVLIHGQTALYKFLDKRITLEASEVKNYITDGLDELLAEHINASVHCTLNDALDCWFKQPQSLLVDYSDFSVSNILYAGLAGLYNNSLEYAGKLFGDILGLPKDAVILNSDESVFLKATTQSGHIIQDEGDIVNWNNPNDKIVDIFTLSPDGKKTRQKISEKCKSIIDEADIIIFSAGTQWSSLIPTYYTIGMNETIKNSKAKKFLVMNIVQDKDIKGCSGNEVISSIEKYLSLNDVSVIQSHGTQPELLVKTDYYKLLKFDAKEGQSKHDGAKLTVGIFTDYFKNDTLGNDVVVFDYDDTLVARGNSMQEISKQNMEMFLELRNSYICTGNSIRSLNIPTKLDYSGRVANVFADGGVNLYEVSLDSRIQPVERITLKEYLDSSMLFTDDEVKLINRQLEEIGIPLIKVQNRGNAIIAIKPIQEEYREIVKNLLQLTICADYNIEITGRTTVEIKKKNLDKTVILSKFPSKITFVGDEPEGNDRGMFKSSHVNFVKVKSPKDTNIFLKLLTLE